MSVFDILASVVYLFAMTIIGRAILSWIMMSTRNETLYTIYQFLTQITEPILGPLRRIVPNIGMIDITPMVAFILLLIIASILSEIG